MASILTGLGALTGCETAPLIAAACPKPGPELDWFEAGRRDGSEGRPRDLSGAWTGPKECAPKPSPGDGDAYLNGWNAGLTEYCSRPAGLEAGRTGQVYFHVCPDHLEKRFMEGYEAGLRIHGLEAENADLAKRIENLFRTLASPAVSADQRPQVSSQLEELRRRRAKNDDSISETERAAGSGSHSF